MKYFFIIYKKINCTVYYGISPDVHLFLVFFLLIKIYESYGDSQVGEKTAP
jgi:hypothetical protein